MHKDTSTIKGRPRLFCYYCKNEMGTIDFARKTPHDFHQICCQCRELDHVKEAEHTAMVRFEAKFKTGKSLENQLNINNKIKN